MIDPRAAVLALQLGRHQSADAEEAQHRDRLVALLGGQAAPFDRDAFSPGHITASGFVIDSGRERLLLVQHRRLGKWLQPGGHVDPGDSDPEAAARREIAEETGIGDLQLVHPAVFDVDVHRYPSVPGGDPVHEHFDVRFAFASLSDRLRATGEVRDARWVAFEDLAGLGVDRSILRPAAKLAGSRAARRRSRGTP